MTASDFLDTPFDQAVLNHWKMCIEDSHPFGGRIGPDDDEGKARIAELVHLKWQQQRPDALEWPGFVRHVRNRFGTWATVLRCQTCGEMFVLCPARTPDDCPWDDCTLPTCESYDINRDVDAMIALGEATLHRGEQPASPEGDDPKDAQ